MMEFTLSRVVLAVCGVLLIGSVIVPITVTEDNTVTEVYQELADGVAEAIDNYYDSSQDMMYLEVEKLLPDTECSLSFDGRIITLDSGKEKYTAFCEHSVNADEESYGSNDLVIFTKNDGGVMVEKIR